MKKTTKDKIYEFICRRYGKNGIPPTMREIARKIGTSHQTVDYHIRSLVVEGKLKRVEDTSLVFFIPNNK